MAMKDSGARNFGRRGFMAAMAAMPLAVASCSQGPKSPIVTPSADAFPVTVDHEFGVTIIDTPPQHVVVLGAAEADICTALGLCPVGMPRSAQTPWFTAAVKAIDAISPVIFDDTQGIPTERIKSLNPDLVLSLGSSVSPNTYDALLEFAPVILQAKNAAVRDWRSNVRLIGRVLGREEAAQTLIETTEEATKASIKDYLGLKGSTVLYLGASSVPGADITVFADSSAPVKLLNEFGLVNAPALKLVQSEGRPWDDSDTPALYLLPHERAADLSADVLVVSLNGDDMAAYKATRSVPWLPTLGKGQIYVVSGNEALSLEQDSPLGIAWAGRNVVPELAKAAYLAASN